MSLYEQAVYWASEREWFTRQRFQRVMRVGFVKRDQLLIEMVDNGVIRQIGPDRFEAIG